VVGRSGTAVPTIPRERKKVPAAFQSNFAVLPEAGGAFGDVSWECCGRVVDMISIGPIWHEYEIVNKPFPAQIRWWEPFVCLTDWLFFHQRIIAPRLTSSSLPLSVSREARICSELNSHCPDSLFVAVNTS